MANVSTADRILDTAEELFAERGFAETSLRTITSCAGVNLAAVNYHFGSKKALIQAVFERYLTPFCHALEQGLDARLAASDTQSLELEDVITLIVSTSLDISNDKTAKRASVFMRLLGLAYTQSQAHLRHYIKEKYSSAFYRFFTELTSSAPQVSEVEAFWRIHFALGSAIFTMSGIESLLAICENEFDDAMNVDDVYKYMIPFLVGGIRASIDTHQ